MDLHACINSCYGKRILQTPFTNKDERQRFACIALGAALPLTFYEPLHSPAQTEVNVVDFFSENDDISSQVKHLSFIYVRYCN